MFIKTISNSKSDTWQQCKLKYRFRYVDRLPEPQGTNTEALHFGSYIHKVLEEGINAKTVEELQLVAEECKGAYKISKKYTGKDLVCIRNFLPFKEKLSEIVATELVYEVPIKDDITGNGVIDLIVKGTKGGYLVIDYKTSKREKTKVDLYQDEQLKGYAHAVSKLYNVPVTEIVCAHYYPLTNNFVDVKYSPTQIALYLKKVVDRVWRIRKSKKEDMKPSRNDFCNWCALEFHHKDPSTKEFTLGSGTITEVSWDKCLEEAKKCMLLCNRCHREEHYLAQELEYAKRI